MICPSYAAVTDPVVEGKVVIYDRDGHPRNDNSGVVVFLDELENPSTPFRPSHVTMSQARKMFEPEVLPIVVGTAVDFSNEDTVDHNIFSLSKANPFDLGIFGPGVTRSVTFNQPGLVKVYCNIHPDMVGYILVLDNPYFTVTDKEGVFVIHHPPLGTATVRIWSTKTREQPEQKIRITSEGIKDLEFRLAENLKFQIKEDTVIIKHRNKWGQDYPEKY